MTDFDYILFYIGLFSFLSLTPFMWLKFRLAREKFIAEKEELIEENKKLEKKKEEYLDNLCEEQKRYGIELEKQKRIICFYENLYSSLYELSKIVSDTKSIKLSHCYILETPKFEIFETSNIQDYHTNYLRQCTGTERKEILECVVENCEYKDETYNLFKNKVLNYIQKYGYSIKGFKYLHQEKQIKFFFEGDLS